MATYSRKVPKALLYLFAVIIINTTIFSCSNDSHQSEVSEPTITKEQPQKKPDTNSFIFIEPKPAAHIDKWDYSEKEDPMTSKQRFFARITAEHPLEFHRPYGTVYPNLLIRKNTNGNTDVMLTISEGQFLSNYGDERSVKARFDKGNAMVFGYSNPSDYSSTTIFIDNARKFISNLKTAKKLIIQSEFYNEGIQTIEFDVEGFKWNH